MAEKEASLLITLKDNVSSGLSKIKGEVLKFTAAVGGLVAILGASLKAYADQEQAVVKLNNALKNQGVFSDQTSKQYQALANEMQRTTGVADEQILSMQALLTTFGVGPGRIKETTQAVLNLSSGLGIDLNTATLLVGKAFAGQTETLSRYGLRIDESIPKGERFTAVLEQINQRFGGAAQANLTTVSGKFADIKNRLSDLAEEIGSAVVPYFNAFYNAIKSVTDGVNQMGGIFNTILIMSTSILQSFVQGLMYAVNSIPGFSNLLKLVGVDLQTINTSLETQITNLMNTAIQDQITADQQIANSNRKTNTQMQNEKNWTKVANEEAKKREAAAKKEVEEKMKLEIRSIQNRRQIEEAANQARYQNFVSTLNSISSLSTAKNKQLAAIGKAAGIAQATIDTYAAANKALASAPPPYNFILAALVTTAGLANVARISGIPLAEGGLVMPRTGGVPATIAEAGKPEVVIPLGDERTGQALRESGLSGPTINVNVGVLVGSENNVRELARMIDRELFGLRRNNESVAFESI